MRSFMFRTTFLIAKLDFKVNIICFSGRGQNGARPLLQAVFYSKINFPVATVFRSVSSLKK